ncbi:MAG TPA: hypothetical protein VFL67_01305, partial [Mycobacterium sp.]|nr:hypothetical protein [Mycobacterium sp.]
MQHLPELDEAHRRWQILLEKLAVIDEQLAAEYLERIEGGARYYDSVPDPNDLKDSARDAFRYLLGRLLKRPLTDYKNPFPKPYGPQRPRPAIAWAKLSAADRPEFLDAGAACYAM